MLGSKCIYSTLEQIVQEKEKIGKNDGHGMMHVHGIEHVMYIT